MPWSPTRRSDHLVDPCDQASILLFLVEFRSTARLTTLLEQGAGLRPLPQRLVHAFDSPDIVLVVYVASIHARLYVRAVLHPYSYLYRSHILVKIVIFL